MKRILSILLCSLLLLQLLSSCSRPAIAPMIADDYLSLGEKFLLELNYEHALVQFLGAIEIDPMNPRGYTGAAEAYAGMELYDRAMGILQQGLEELSGSQGFLRDAAEIYEGIIDNDPMNPDAYIGLTEIYLMLGENENAYDVLMIGAKRLPDNADIAQMLSDLEELMKPEPTDGSDAPSDGRDTTPTDERDAAPTDDNDAAPPDNGDATPDDGEVSPDDGNVPTDVSELLANNANEDPASTEPSTALNSTVGNTAGNLSNGGLVCEYGGYIYFIHDASIYRTKNGSETPEHIFSYTDGEERLSALNIIDGQIYVSLFIGNLDYSNYEQSSILSMSLNGGDAVKLAEDCHSITVTENYILGQDGSRNLLRMDHDGGHKIIVKDGSSLYGGLEYSYYDGWLYYVTSDGTVARMNAETMDEERVSAIGVTIGMSGWSYISEITCGVSGFYFGDVDGEVTTSWIQRIDFFSGKIEQIFNNSARHYNERDGWIYFSRFDEGYFDGVFYHMKYVLARISIDGANIQDLCDDYPSSVFVTRDWVYYELYNEDYFAIRSLYRVPLSGGAPEFVM